MEENKKIRMYVGTYTKPLPFLKTSEGRGIYVYDLDLSSGELIYICHEDLDNPSYLAIDSNNQYLYAVSELKERGYVHAFLIDQKTGKLGHLNTHPTEGAYTCYVKVDQTNQLILVANYMSGNANIFPINQDGGLQPMSEMLRFQGSGLHPKRQQISHPHCFINDPTNQFAYLPDLGTDKVMSFRLDLLNRKVIPNDPPSIDLPPGSGPRDLMFHPKMNYAYLIGELQGIVSVLAFNDKTGELSILQNISTLPEGFDDPNTSACVQIEPSGKYLYASNRGHDSVAIYEINESSGRLSYLAHESTQGEKPRNIVVDPTGTYLFAANQDSHSIVSFKINHDDGKLKSTGYITEIPNPAVMKCTHL